MSQKFCNILVTKRYNVAAPYAFVEVVKVMNHTGLWDFKLTWYFQYYLPECLCDLQHNFWINSFRPTWTCLIVEVLTTWTIFLEPSGYCTVINCTFIFHSTNIFGCFHGIVAWTMLHIHLCGFQITHVVKQCTCQCISYHDTTNHTLNCFGHVIYMLQTGMYYQNIVKL